MNIVLIAGSMKTTGGESGRVTRWLAQKIEADGHSTFLRDLGQDPLPQWDEGLWGTAPHAEKWEEIWQPLKTRLAGADGVVLVTPEYNGTASAAMKNFLHILGGMGTVDHKPVQLVSVSAGVNGAYPIQELRGTGLKNNKMVAVPDHIIVRNASDMLVDDTPRNQFDADLRERIDYSLPLFYLYCAALAQVRESDVVVTKKFVFGM